MSLNTASAWLRVQPALTGSAPPLDQDSFGDDPVAMFLAWIHDAAARGVPEPHVATLATVDAAGVPDARALSLKDVSEQGWGFAGSRDSRKAAQLAVRPVAAMNFWWQPVLRAVRVRGAVVEASAQESAADLAARSSAAREGIVPGEWVLWRIVPTRIEFWQGSVDRKHTRIVFERTDGTWSREPQSREPQHLHDNNQRRAPHE